jgi:hypothetical protein
MSVVGFFLGLPRGDKVMLTNDYAQSLSMALIIAALLLGLASIISGASSLDLL